MSSDKKYVDNLINRFISEIKPEFDLMNYDLCKIDKHMDIIESNLISLHKKIDKLIEIKKQKYKNKLGVT